MDKSFVEFNDGFFYARFNKKNGQTGYLFTKWQFEFDNSGKAIRLYGILQDISERKIAEEERERMITDILQRNRDLEQFAFIISHNLRAPMANIIGFTTILQDETITATEQKDFLRALSLSATQLDSVIIDLNKILQTKREVEAKKEIVSFNAMLSDITISISSNIATQHITIQSNFSEVNEIYSVKGYIHSIFYNLINNSIKYRKPDEPLLIDITSKKEKGNIVLVFKDNGLGIDIQKHGDKLFRLYNRFHSHVEGKGMGLFMTKTQVELIGGKITVVSEPGEGAEFTIVLQQ